MWLAVLYWVYVFESVYVDLVSYLTNTGLGDAQLL